MWKPVGSSAKASGFGYTRVSFLAEKPGYLPEMANLAVALAKALCFLQKPHPCHPILYFPVSSDIFYVYFSEQPLVTLIFL